VCVANWRVNEINMYLISLILVIIAVVAFYYTEHVFWCATGLAFSKFILYISFEKYAWWSSLFTALIIYVFAYLYFWLLTELEDKPYAYWTILGIGGLVLLL